MSAEHKFKPGDVVRTRDGLGPIMLVRALSKDTRYSIDCGYWKRVDGAYEHITESFVPEELKLVEKPDASP